MTDDVKLPEPETSVAGIYRFSGYTADQMREFARAAVLAERDRCARVCEAESLRLQGSYVSMHDDRHIGADECAAAIRKGER